MDRSLAIEMLEGVREFAARTGPPLDLRIGLHAGPVVAGVIGRKKFSYDLRGDTVNLASRMESHAQPGHIQVTREVRDALGDAFALEPRGPIEVKGKGLVETWFLLSDRVGVPRRLPEGADQRMRWIRFETSSKSRPPAAQSSGSV